jgi:hypothetical protein
MRVFRRQAAAGAEIAAMNLPQQARRHDAVSLIDDYMGRFGGPPR